VRVGHAEHTSKRMGQGGRSSAGGGEG